MASHSSTKRKQSGSGGGPLSDERASLTAHQQCEDVWHRLIFHRSERPVFCKGRSAAGQRSVPANGEKKKTNIKARNESKSFGIRRGRKAPAHPSSDPGPGRKSIYHQREQSVDSGICSTMAPKSSPLKRDRITQRLPNSRTNLVTV